ncbi:ATP-binding protein [Alteribacter natronophilus]|uniref:ATP-binding protein n=1 Tax=Alteribacter natronophilus TaxID=2583810 RepID=UPI00110DE482|nr:ATP-binding protein [Alteribacter natronophilus]TMW73646.1 cell wall metabolism sensor histidine kinase WalK [Alteribacter natronophilus]
MFWRSVVGKLWATILLLVSVVLLVLTVLLLQYFDRFHSEQAEEQLLNHASLIVGLMEDNHTGEAAVAMGSRIADTYATKSVIVLDEEEYWYSSGRTSRELPIELFYSDSELARVMSERETVVQRGGYELNGGGGEYQDLLLVGKPFISDGQTGAVYLYQPLDIVEEASAQTKNIIFLSAGVAIVLTTVFAFFLTTRITAPLRRMRKASLEVAKGNFNAKVPIQTSDEIGLLAMAFNRMARTLNVNLAALNREKEQLSRILSSMADGVITVDRRGEMKVMNPPAESFAAAWRFENGSESDSDLPEEIGELYRKVLENEEEQIVEVDVQGRNWVIVMTPLYDDSNIRGAVAVLRDMTEERLHDKLRKDFVANVSHELRTPISMLQGYSEAIIDDIAGSEEEKKELAQIIYDESLRMGRLVNELLDLARMEAGHIQLNVDETDLREFAKRVFKKFTTVANEHNVELSGEIGHVSRNLAVDEDRMEQVLTNLLDNAVRHTPENGRVTLVLEEEENGVRFDVKDTGCGIPEEDLPFVFERFYKADKARTRGRAGTGLGLAIVKNIVHAHKGKVSVHSKVNEGTTFSVFIPEN